MADLSIHLNRTGKRQISGFALPLITVTEIKLTYKLNHASNLHRNLLSLTWRTLGYDRTRVENHCSRSLHQRQRQSYNSDHSLKNETNINFQLRQLNLRAISLPRTAFITMVSFTCISIRLKRQFGNNRLHAIPSRCRYRQIL